MAVARGRYPYLPVAMLMKDSFRSDHRIARVLEPKLFVHGDLDTSIPLSSGKALFDAAPEPKTVQRPARAWAQRHLDTGGGRRGDRLRRYGHPSGATRIEAGRRGRRHSGSRWPRQVASQTVAALHGHAVAAPAGRITTTDMCRRHGGTLLLTPGCQQGCARHARAQLEERAPRSSEPRGSGHAPRDRP